MAERHAAAIEALRRGVVEEPGVLSSETRRDIVAGGAPEGFEAYLDAVRQHAYRVTDADVARLRAEGRTEDEVFEATVSAAVGAGLLRLEAGLEALR